MQKLFKRSLKNTPRNTSLVPGNCGSVLNNPKGLVDSVQDLKTLDNTSEVNYTPIEQGEQNPRVSVVYVQNKRGEPLMLCSPRKARKLLKKGDAHVVNWKPFIIQLNIVTGETKQEISMGVDIGYQNVGVSARTEKNELYASEIKLKTDIVKLNSEHRMYRKNRRN
jgi:N6-L-threonylcarbamoyladenine synthase